jgi:hypothetical protein
VCRSSGRRSSLFGKFFHWPENVSTQQITRNYNPFSALTENIVKVLPKFKCPHSIEPHQIQGLDCIRIAPVMTVISNKFEPKFNLI